MKSVLLGRDIFFRAISFLLLLPTFAAAQQPTLTTTSAVVAAGPDYRTDILGNPWDFSDELDLSPLPYEFSGWTITDTAARSQGRAAFLNGGRFVGQTADASATIPLLYRGGRNWIQSNTENTGYFDHKAIPTSRYGKLSLAMTISGSIPAGASLIAYYYGARYEDPSQTGSGVILRDLRPGTHIYTLDLESRTYLTERGVVLGEPLSPIDLSWALASWVATPLVRALHIRPFTNASPVSIAVDWVRLTQRDGAAGTATVPVRFTGCTGRQYSVEVQSPSGSWDVIHSGVASATTETTANVNYGVLPPGVWTLRVSCFPGDRSTTPVASQNSLSLTVNMPPTISIANPDAAGGADFATDVLRNPWDWNAVTDAAQIYASAPTIVSDGGSNALQAFSPPGSDPAVVLLYGRYEIDTARYRNATFDLTLDTPFGLGGGGEGSVARLFWERPSATGGNAVAISQDILVWPGRNTYTIDLSSLRLANGQLESECMPWCQQIDWSASPVRYFRIDPHENTQGITFRLGRVLLSTPDEALIGSPYAIQYRFDDADTAGSTYTARIYLDSDRDPASKQLIRTISGASPNALQTYSFDAAAEGVPVGEYFVYVEVTEQRGGLSDTRGMYAGGPLRVRAAGGASGGPGAPTLSATQVTQNPVTLSWTPGAGAAPTSYTIQAGTSPGASNLAVFNLGMQTSVSAMAPPGGWIYARVVAANASGSAVSNEISFVLGPPPAPTLSPASVSGRTVTLSWSSSPGATGYAVLARLPGSPAVVAWLPVGGQALSVPGAPSGTYVVTVVALNQFGAGAESNSVVVTVP